MTMKLVTGSDASSLGGRPNKLAIVGAGSVGATLAYSSLMRGAARTVALYDINTNKVRAEALDLGHGLQFMPAAQDRKSTRLNSSHVAISYAVFCLKKKTKQETTN